MSTVLVATEDSVTPFDPAGGAHRAEVEGRRISALARDGHEWLGVADSHTVVRRDPAGHWSDVASSDSELTCLVPAPEGAHVGTADARVLRLFRGAFSPVEGFDAVSGRDEWHAVGSRVPYVRSITSTVTGTLLASVHVGGIPRSANGGASWKPTIDVEADVHQVRAHPVLPDLVVAAAAVGFAESLDAGATWTVAREGLHAHYLRAVAFTRTSILFSAADGPRGGQSALYRRATDGGAFERCRDGLPEWLAGNIDTGCLDSAYRLGDAGAAAFGDVDGTLYVSTDDGTTWRALATDLGTITAVGVQAQ